MIKSVRHGKICQKEISGSVWKYWYYLEKQEISDTHHVLKKVLDTLYMA